MATRSRRVAEPKGASSARVGIPVTSATSSATTSRTRTANTGPTATTRATRSTKITSATNATVKDEKSAPAVKKTVVKKVATSKTKPAVEAIDEIDREPIQAFLRIRPNHQKDVHSPYLVALSDTTVQMTDPSNNVTHAHTLSPPTMPTAYTFTHIFNPSTTQYSFFKRSALPLVKHLLQGQNGLLFAYGVTNSGKTYSIQGGKTSREAGILPRTLDVVFRSIKGWTSTKPLKPLGLSGIEVLEGDEDGNAEGLTESERNAAAMIDQVLAHEGGDVDVDAEMENMDHQGNADEDTGNVLDEDGNTKEIAPADNDHEYAVWVSYAEVYNEKIFDLLSIDDNHQPSGAVKSANAPGSVSSYMSLAALAASGSSNSISSSLAGNSGSVLSSSTSLNGQVTLRRRALALKTSPDGKGKYIHGLREIRVKTAEDAKNVLKMGVVNRRVFGTLANKASSRSHAIFTVKVARIHKQGSEDVSVSRLSIVDLAGSERARNAGTMRAGGESDRLREAGNINKSLMVLGQCLEALRTNQRKLTTAASTGTKDGGVQKPRLAIVPFRHSKITEIFQDFFVGEGRAVMIININPYDTGFDENSHVMKFAAIAREVSTNTAATGPGLNSSKPPSFLPPSNAASRAPSRLKGARAGPSYNLGVSTNHTFARKVVLSLDGSINDGRREFSNGPRTSVNTVVDIIEEDADMEEGLDGEDDDAYPLVDELFARIEELELKLYEAEMRAAIIETETREEVAMEMQERMELMDKMYRERLSREAEENDRKTDEKMDLLSRALRTGTGMGSPFKMSVVSQDKHRGDVLKRFTPDMTMVSDATMDEEIEVGESLNQSEEEDDINGSPSARYGSQPLNKGPSLAKKATSPIKSKSPSKQTRVPSIEVSDNESEPEFPDKPDLVQNPIMDMVEEDDAVMTDPEANTDDTEEEEPFEASQAEEGEVEESVPASSEGEGDTIDSENASDDTAAIEDSFDAEEDEDPKTKYVFEPLVQPSSKAGQGKPSSAIMKPSGKETGKAKLVVESSEEESFDLDTVHSDEGEEDDDEIDMLSPSKVAALKAGGKAKAGGVVKANNESAKSSKKKGAVVDKEMDDLASRIGKTAIRGDENPRGQVSATRKSTRTKG